MSSSFSSNVHNHSDFWIVSFIPFGYLNIFPNFAAKRTIYDWKNNPYYQRLWKDCDVFSTINKTDIERKKTKKIIINLDLPWNPAVLEQRIGRIYRLGQQRNVQERNLVAVGTKEERMIGKLRFKQNMFEGVLDNGDDTINLLQRQNS